MTKYIYEIFEILYGKEPKLGDELEGGVVVDIIGGIEDERLVVIGYENG